MISQVPSGLGGKVSAKSKPRTTRTAFVVAVINAGIGTFLGTTAGFLVGGLADAVSSLGTGQLQLHYGLILTQAGLYIGIFLAIVAGIGTSATSAPAVTTTVESQDETAELPRSSTGPPIAGTVEPAANDEEHSHAA